MQSYILELPDDVIAHSQTRPSITGHKHNMKQRKCRLVHNDVFHLNYISNILSFASLMSHGLSWLWWIDYFEGFLPLIITETSGKHGKRVWWNQTRSVTITWYVSRPVGHGNTISMSTDTCQKIKKTTTLVHSVCSVQFK